MIVHVLDDNTFFIHYEDMYTRNPSLPIEVYIIKS